MTETPGIILFEPNGPTQSGLSEWGPIDPGEILQGTPVQRGHVYDEDPAFGYLTGVWDCTAFIGKSSEYTEDELMILLEGTLTLVMGDGSEINVSEGDAFVIPKGLNLQWKQPRYLRKIFMIVNDPAESAGSNSSLDRVTVINPAECVLSPGGIETKVTSFVNGTGRMEVSVRTLATGSTPERPAGTNQIMHVVSGDMTVSSGGREHRLQPGHTVYVRKGAFAGISVSEGTKLVQTTFDPG